VTNTRNRSGTYNVRSLDSTAGPIDAIALHWPEYLMEGVELGVFMVVACSAGTLLFYEGSPVVRYLPSAMSRLVLMGLTMGLTAIAIIRSPFGRRSGAHFNPAVSITFLCLRKMHWLDTVFYVAAQFAGGTLGVLLAHALIGSRLAAPSVRYVVTVPGFYGITAAFAAEFFMGWLMMTVVLISSNRVALASFTWLLVGLLVMLYVIVFSPVSGFSVNPARTFSSAIVAHIWTAIWLYFSAPVLGMLAAAGLYVLWSGPETVYCGKLYHDLHSPCPFRCRFQQLTQTPN
jgi:aquaporin Z